MPISSGLKKLFFGNAYEEDEFEENEVDVSDTDESVASNDVTDEKPASRFFNRGSSNFSMESKRSDKTVNLNASSKLSVVLFKPERYEDVAEVAAHLRSGHSVVLNLETTDRDIARRVLDFLSGVAYALDGDLKMVSTNTYIITPNGVAIQGDLIDELEISGLYL